MHLDTHSVTYDDKVIDFSKREFSLLLYFAQNHTRIIPKSELAEKVWGIYDVWENHKIVEVYIGYLRKKNTKHYRNTKRLRIYTQYTSIIMLSHSLHATEKHLITLFVG